MTNRPRRIEFLIVGGGPAGSAAAVALATAGREVLVIERSDYGGTRFGETLPPAANPVLTRLGLTRDMASVEHLRCPGTACVWGDEEPYLNDYVFDPDGYGLHLDRATFDALLARKAASAGVEVLQRSEIRACRRDRSEWDVEVASPLGARHLRAGVLIDAAGRRPWSGRPSRRRAFDRQVALVGTFASGEDTVTADRRTWVEAAPSGWWYSASLPGDRLAVAYFTDADLIHAHKRRRDALWDVLLRQTLRTCDRLQRSRLMGDLRVVAASSTIAEPIAGDGYIAIGDAASTIDPLSSHGILYALTSGLDAAKALVDPNPARAVELYVQGVAARLRDDLSTRLHFCRSERRWPDSPFWLRRSATLVATVPESSSLFP
jgi:flavin-dependent dehydrogenase